MGRERVQVQLRRIKDKTSRQVCFSKRCGGLLKKANDVAVLCDVEVGLIVFSATGMLHEYSSASSMENIIRRYRQFSEAERAVHVSDPGAQVRPTPSMPESQLDTKSKLMEIAQRYLDEANVNQLNLNELEEVEKRLEAALRQTMSRRGKMMQEEMQFLELIEENARKDTDISRDYQHTLADTSLPAMPILPRGCGGSHYSTYRP